jgi:hypothetical protein
MNKLLTYIAAAPYILFIGFAIVSASAAAPYQSEPSSRFATRLVVFEKCGAKCALCKKYAKTAVNSQKLNQKLACGYRGGRWSSSLAGHFNWCMRPGTSAAATRKEQAIRDDRTRACFGKLASVCAAYADGAVLAAQINQNLNCGLTGLSANGNRSAHFNWCVKTLARQLHLDAALVSAQLFVCQAKAKSKDSLKLLCKFAEQQERIAEKLAGGSGNPPKASRCH